MKCYTCKSTMRCYDDINNEMSRVDYYECTKCKSKALVIYGNNGEYINKVVWER